MARTLENFGRNVRWSPREYRAPASEEEVLDILSVCASRKIRVVGALHSWSDIVPGDDVVLDMTRLSEVKVAPDRTTVTVGPGCRIAALLDALRSHNLTLPTIGAVTRQTIGGAISTGTHGSGKPSLSHYVRAMRIATYHPDTRRPFVLELNAEECPEGDQRRAKLHTARCSLGYLGVILSVTLECRPRYDVSETLALVDSLDEVLGRADEYPLQQFFSIPYAWTYYVYRRRDAGDPRRATPVVTRLGALAYRAYKWLIVDVLLHLIVKVLAIGSRVRLLRSGSRRPGGVTRWFYRYILPRLALRGVTVIDASEHILTLHHDLYRHIEMEVLVPARHIREGLGLVRYITDEFAGEPTRPPATIRAGPPPSIVQALSQYRGTYTHHYVIVCRRVHADETLISMTCGNGDDFYSMSFFNYSGLNPNFSNYCDALARCLADLYEARLHWGKYIPPAFAETIRNTYPADRLELFRRICSRYDIAGVFRNAYACNVVGFP